MKFKIEQLALNPKDPARAFALMDLLGLNDWSNDQASAAGEVHGKSGSNVASLSFNHQAETPVELEILNYQAGDNWLAAVNAHTAVASHIGTHCSAEELEQWRAKLLAFGVTVAQEVVTTRHTNPNVPQGRSYKYVIFDTRDIIGLDVKFIVRR